MAELTKMPMEMIFEILDKLTGDHPYRHVEQIVAMETVLGLQEGALLARYPFEKTLFEESTSMNQWNSFVTAIDSLVLNQQPKWFIAGGFVARKMGRTKKHRDVDVYLSIDRPFGSWSTPPGWMQGDYYGFPSNNFLVYNKTNCPFQIIVYQDIGASVRDICAGVMNSFDLQICQCSMLPCGEIISLASCNTASQHFARNPRKVKYNARVQNHGRKCKRARCNHWEEAY